ncbi:hypothetical protein [Runella aurantiaca]|uniref:Uncharacterized protein n=1 Tax=Runella aurantiaca TaxID=2282308 RepID=A0A369I265_9BACT|nr:hypothetical protein [Runella aurantiaca]RDB03871.1 hypothetical protein DVG78_21720 [Runella aurantiaca]
MNFKKHLLALFLLFLLIQSSYAQVWQWSVSVDSVISNENNSRPQAFLWIPENCKHVRGVILCQHNMIEEGILENASFRKTMTELGFAEVWITPALDITFDFTKGVDRHFERMMKSLADVSGYAELATAPIVPMGHSALASYPWNFAAWNPNRTLAVISIHGDSPLTKLTGSGRPNPDWGNRSIEGLPSLFVMGEYEWWEARIQPGFDYVEKYPKTPISFFADAGHGHFDYSVELINYLALFIKKAAHYRLQKKEKQLLLPIDPQKGWLMDRWHKDSLPTAQAKPYALYQGNRKQASWCFDEEMTIATERFYAKARGKQNQQLGFIQHGNIIKPTGGHANYNLKFMPLEDGISFHLKGFFADTSRLKPTLHRPKSQVSIDRICGPVRKISNTTFQINFYRMGFNNPKRSNDIWLLASNNGDEHYKSAVQQLNMRFPLVNKEGKAQKITFSTLSNQKVGNSKLPLTATSDAGLSIYYYVKEGPAKIQGTNLIFTKIPPKSKFPVKVTVVAWQYGIAGKVQSAEPVEKYFYIMGSAK